MDEATSKGFFKFMIDRGYTDENARQIIARHNTFKDTRSDKAILREYLGQKERTGADQEGKTPEPIKKTTTKGDKKTMKREEKELQTTRINATFTQENYDYIVTMAKICGMSAAGFLNEITRKSLENNREAYERAKHFRVDLK